MPTNYGTLAFIMGCTGAGKSTLLERLRMSGRKGIEFIEVGKMMRAKYPPEHFAGQAAPKHTAEEAWSMCENAVKAASRNTIMRLVVIDGQPRDVEQVCRCVERFPGWTLRFYMLHVPANIREERLRATRDAEEFEKLSSKRVTNDMISYNEVLGELYRRGQTVHWRFPFDGGMQDNNGLPLTGTEAIGNIASELLSVSGVL